MKLDFLLQFYWPSRKRHPGKDAARRGNRRLSGEAQEELNESRDRKLPVWIVVLGIVWLLAFSVEALGDKSRMADQRNVIFDRLGTGQGLSQAAVSAITQDKQGFIWVGTQEGLNRYDGYEFQTFYHMDDDPNSLSHDSIWDLMVDSDGSLWIGTDSGLNRYDADSGRFEFYSLDTGLEVGGRHVAVHTMFQDSSQRMWIGTSTGLVQLTGDGEFISYTHQPGNPETIGRGSVRAIFEDSQGRLWIGTELGGLNLFDPSSGSFIRYESVAADPDTISDNYIRNIIEDRSGNLWLATFNGGVSIFNPATGEAERLRHTASLRVRALLMDQQGSIWVGTDGGLNLWNPATRDFERYTVDPTDIHSISDNTVFEIFQDQGGVIWVGTFNGISKWNARTETFPHFKQSARSGQNLTSNSITSFAETREGDVWIGSFEGLNRWNATLGTFVDTSGLNVLLSDDLVMSLAIHDDLLWVGTMAGGINLVEGNEVIGVIRHDPADPSSISSDAVSKIFVDSKNQVWLTTYGGGVNLYLGDGKFRRFPDPANPLGRFRDL
ncbi:MAG: hypothetical protein KDI36_19420, partial [Pseudomonadales bacterium]|nr:hypothetical protein [Pseudomonadales bacterium]